MRSWASLAVLAILVAALGAWVYNKPRSGGADTHALSGLKASEVQRIRYARPANPPAASDAGIAQKASAEIVLERQGAGWRMTAPFSARADETQVERLLSILQAHSQARYDAHDLARYGLGEPHAVLTLQDQTFAYGAINNMTREQYVLTRDAVYLVPVAFATGLPRNAEALLARKLLAGHETPARFELPAFSVVLEDGRWVLAPDANEAGADERNAWVDTWRAAHATRALRNDSAASPEDMRIVLKDGSTVVIGILRREPEVVLVRRDEGIEYHFFAETGKRLLSPPGTAAQDGAKK